MSIFREYAPQYWGAGIPVMPLKVQSKAPLLLEWVSYGRIAPSRAVQEVWLQNYPNSNIGLPFGPASGLCAIDIDTDDPELMETIRDILPATPWERVGKKGVGMIFKWQGQKNFKIRSDEGMICEFLGLGNQMVMPPSIHPDTGRAYTANSTLWEVIDKIQPLPMDVEEKLRAALGVRGVSLAHDGRSAPLVVVPQGERDIQLVRHAGYLARIVLGIDRKIRLSLAQAMEHMHTWVSDFTARSAGDDLDPQKGVDKLLEFLMRDIESGKTLPPGWDNGLTQAQLAHPAIAAMLERNDSQKWTYSRAKDWISAAIEERIGDDDHAVEKIHELIGMVGQDNNFTDLAFGALVPVLQNMSGNIKIGKVELNKAFKAARRGENDVDADHEAIANTVIEELERGGEMRHSQGSFWQWNGSCYMQLSDDEIYKVIAQSVKGNTLARRHNDYAAIVKVAAVLAKQDLFDKLERGVNFANGFLDSEGELHDHSPKFGKTFTMPFNYIPERANEAHKWLKFLEDCWGDDPDYTEKVMALQEAFAATMFGDACSYQRAILLHGKAGAGKSQVLEVLREMMPPAAVCSVPPHRWSGRFDLTGMIGKSLNVCGELPEEGTIDGRAFKEVVEGTIQNTEFKGKDSFHFKPMAAQWFASNFLPQSRDTSEGFTRRWLILDFNRVVPLEERLRNFAEMLVADEREAIAAWAIRGWQRLIKNGDYTLPESHVFRLAQVRRSNNSVFSWLQMTDKITVTNDKGDWADARDCFDQYVWYMKDVSRGLNMSFERFIQVMGDLGHMVDNYSDIAGIQRYRLSGLKPVSLAVNDKWRAQ